MIEKLLNIEENSKRDIKERVLGVLKKNKKELGEFRNSVSYNPLLQEILENSLDTFGKKECIYEPTEDCFNCILDDSLKDKEGLFYILHRDTKNNSTKVYFDDKDHKAISAAFMSKDFNYSRGKVRTCVGFVENNVGGGSYSFFCYVFTKGEDGLRSPFRLILEGNFPCKGSMAAKCSNKIKELEYKINDVIKYNWNREFLPEAN